MEVIFMQESLLPHRCGGMLRTSPGLQDILRLNALFDHFTDKTIKPEKIVQQIPWYWKESSFAALLVNQDAPMNPGHCALVMVQWYNGTMSEDWKKNVFKCQTCSRFNGKLYRTCFRYEVMLYTTPEQSAGPEYWYWSKSFLTCGSPAHHLLDGPFFCRMSCVQHRNVMSYLKSAEGWVREHVCSL